MYFSVSPIEGCLQFSNHLADVRALGPGTPVGGSSRLPGVEHKLSREFPAADRCTGRWLEGESPPREKHPFPTHAPSR